MNENPTDIEAERAVLGTCVLNPDEVPGIIDVLGEAGSQWFYDPFHRAMYDAIVELRAEGRPVDVVTIFPKVKNLDESYGTKFGDIVSSVPNWLNGAEYAVQVREAAGKRLVLDAMRGNLDGTEQRTASEIRESVRRCFEKSEQATISQIIRLDASAAQVLETIEEQLRTHQTPGVETGFYQFDDLLSGWQPATTNVVAACPSVGKTALVLNFACTAAITNDYHVLFFSLEMSREACTERILARMASVNMSVVRHDGFQAEQQLGRAKVAAQKFKDAKFYIADNPNPDIGEVHGYIQSHAKKFGVPDLVVIDYLQLMSADKGSNRQEEVSVISRRVKQISREINAPIILVSQLSRAAVEAKQPALHHLRESGSIEQDADVVILLHKAREDGELVFCNVAKNRNGRTGYFELKFDKATQRFEA